MLKGNSKLETWQVESILLAKTSDNLTARLYGVSRTTISNIRNGTSYKSVRPDIERRKRTHRIVRPDPATLEVSCLKCAHWYKNECSFSFPDPVREGVHVAEECAMYQL